MTTNTQPLHVRRWDQPETPDPYPERLPQDQGVRQREAPYELDDWESKNGLPTTRTVVKPATPAPGQMTATDTKLNGRSPVTANNFDPDQTPGRPITYWAVGLSIIAQTTITTALLFADPDPLRSLITSASILACSTALVTAEQITVRR